MLIRECILWSTGIQAAFFDAIVIAFVITFWSGWLCKLAFHCFPVIWGWEKWSVLNKNDVTEQYTSGGWKYVKDFLKNLLYNRVTQLHKILSSTNHNTALDTYMHLISSHEDKLYFIFVLIIKIKTLSPLDPCDHPFHSHPIKFYNFLIYKSFNTFPKTDFKHEFLLFIMTVTSFPQCWRWF